MKSLYYHLVVISLLWLSGSLVRAQTPPMLSNESAKPVESKSYQPQSQSQPQTALRRLGKHQSGQPIQNRIQIPKRAQPTTTVLIFFSAVVGAVLFIGLFTFAQFLLNRDAPFGWYTFYLMATAIWLWQSTPVGFNSTQQPSDPPVFFVYMKLLVYGMIVSYIRFLSYLLEVPQQHPV